MNRACPSQVIESIRRNICALEGTRHRRLRHCPLICRWTDRRNLPDRLRNIDAKTDSHSAPAARQTGETGAYLLSWSSHRSSIQLHRRQVFRCPRHLRRIHWTGDSRIGCRPSGCSLHWTVDRRAIRPEEGRPTAVTRESHRRLAQEPCEPPCQRGCCRRRLAMTVP